MSNPISTCVRATVSSTEDQGKVEQAIRNIVAVNEVNIESKSSEQSVLVAKGYGREVLTRLKDLIQQEGIRDAARRELLSGTSEGRIIFFLNKQVAYVGHVSFSKETSESPLGPIEVDVTCEDPQNVVDWLAPSSRS
ncbi:MAG: RNA-binding domain-containing protein [archaeon]